MSQMGKGSDLFSKEATLMNSAKRELVDGRVKDPIYKLRLKCFSRGATGILGLARAFRNMDDDNNKCLTMAEFTKGIHDTGLHCTNDEIKQLFDSIDTNGDGAINFDEFLVKLRPAMPTGRAVMIDKAFAKMDRDNDGVITISDLKSMYNVRKNPRYLSGEQTENEILTQFLNNFEGENGNHDGKVTKEEFFNYYSVISAAIDEDIYFDLVMRQAYSL